MSATTVKIAPVYDHPTRPVIRLPWGPEKAHSHNDPAKPCQACAVDELCRRMTPLCESAVDTFEVAAGLEADGLSDQAVHDRYGYANVFTLAEELFRRIPRNPVEPAPQPDPWQAKWTSHVLHGVLYGLPAVCFPAAAPLLQGSAALVILVVSTLIAWTLSQTLSYLGYARMGRMDTAGAHRLLRAGLIVSTQVLLVAMSLTALVMPVRLGALVFATGQGVYLMAATVLLVTGADWLLLAALAPAVLASTAYLVLGEPAGLTLPVWGALTGSTLLAVGFAVTRTLGAGKANGPLLTWTDLRHTLPHALFGLLAAGMLAFPVAIAQTAHRMPGSVALVAALPLSLSMGLAEWALYRYRQGMHRLLRTTRSLSQFAARAIGVLLAAVSRYLLGTALLMAVVGAAAAELGLVHPQWMEVPELAAYLALGGSLFLALVLQALGGGMSTLVACAAALGAEILLLLGHRHWWQGDMVIAQLVVSGTLLAVLFLLAAIVLRKSVRHV